ncbi:MAG TPA: class I SAM-dependent methyltransferase [Pusillimonas sp.]|uniref:class I SAM-dependent methyltransferase n=1 Tax=Pusillimonas sp. TaxID=3040095 RepID=UPI002C8ACDCF|nr:class I SAM-dependent methyltransferase [Pusillimonas sp.]HUH86727.1 class I SAM-dependent methyltransferase [Pusillimonas sp.]
MQNQPCLASPHVSWVENGEQRTALWLTEYSGNAPRRIVAVDDTLTADTAFQLANQGTHMLWRGDYHNARQLLDALARRVDKKKRGKVAATPQQAFNQHRLAQSRRARLLGSILLPVDAGFRIPLRRAPDVTAACEAVLGKVDQDLLLPLRVLQGIMGASEWRRKGMVIPALEQSIHVHYGVFSPIRGEYIDLVANAPLPNTKLAFDIGTGSGVLAAILARRGIEHVIATDVDERALACARDNIERLGLTDRITLEKADLFPQGRCGLIVCNPPWLPARPTSSIEAAIYDPDNRMLGGFLSGLGEHLLPQGEGWLILSDLAEHLGLRDREFLAQAIRSAGLKVLGRLDARPKHPKAMDPDDPLHEARRAEVTTLWRLGRDDG